MIALCACLPENDGYDQFDAGRSTPVNSPVAIDTSISTAESRIAKAALTALQAKSFAANAEYCGYIIRDANGVMTTSQPVQGDTDSCITPELPDDVVAIASFHTHGAFSFDADAEFPSPSDVEADEAEGVDGYISTPGGRLWFVDSSELVVSQLCGIGCLPQDPQFEEGVSGQVNLSYTLTELNNRFDQ